MRGLDLRSRPYRGDCCGRLHTLNWKDASGSDFTGIVAKGSNRSSVDLRIFLLPNLGMVNRSWFFFGGGQIELGVVILSSKEAAPKVHVVCKRL